MTKVQEHSSGGSLVQQRSSRYLLKVSAGKQEDKDTTLRSDRLFGKHHIHRFIKLTYQDNTITICKSHVHRSFKLHFFLLALAIFMNSHPSFLVPGPEFNAWNWQKYSYIVDFYQDLWYSASQYKIYPTYKLLMEKLYQNHLFPNPGPQFWNHHADQTGHGCQMQNYPKHTNLLQRICCMISPKTKSSSKEWSLLIWQNRQQVCQPLCPTMMHVSKNYILVSALLKTL